MVGKPSGRQGDTQKTVGIETDQHEVTAWAKNTLHLSQHTVRVGVEVQRMKCNQHIHAARLEGQFVAMTLHGRIGRRVISRRVNTMVNGTAIHQREAGQRPHLADVVAKRAIEGRLKARLYPLNERAIGVAGIPGFQRRGNLYRLRVGGRLHSAKG